MEFIQQRPTPRSHPVASAFTTLLRLLLALLLLGALAHAQPANWQSWHDGAMTRYQGTEAHGGRWTGSSYVQWSERFYEFTGPDGQTQHCRAYELPSARHRECFP